MERQNNIFKNGSCWLRADFHLHTKADKEFSYTGEENSFVSSYVEKLAEEKIHIGIITNHNKFDKEEYKALARKARKQEIYLLPGIELSVNDGANGIHCLVIFDPKKWLENDTDFISQFLNKTFSGKSNYENKNERSNDNLIGTIEKLNDFDRDYFMIMAHIEQGSGFYKELDGGRIEELGKKTIFRKAVLGFQKVQTRDYIKNIKLWLGEENVPAFVEGSDSKEIEEIGKGEQQTFLKIGDYNFEALKYALIDKKYRQAKEPINSSNGYIKSIAFEGGKMDGITIHLNHAMNNLIGIRGSGKSFILETIRYALDIELSEEQSVDKTYKEGLVTTLLGSGGKITCELFDNQGNEYKLEKILGDPSKIYKNGELQPGLRPNAIINKPIYFGQKDLSKIGDSLSTEYLINKLIGDTLLEKRREIEEKNQEILRILEEIKKVDAKIGRKPEIEAKKAELELKVKTFKKYKIDEKLRKQIYFNKDDNFIKSVKEFEVKIIEDLREFIESHEGFDSYKTYISKESMSEVEKTVKSFVLFEEIFDNLKKTLKKLTEKNKELSKIHEEFTVKYNALKEEFSKIKREIKVSLNIQADDYLKCTRELDYTKIQFSELEKLSQKKRELQKQLRQTLSSLQKLWDDEFKIIQNEIKKVNDHQKSIKIIVDFKGNKDVFKSYLKDHLRGSNLRDNHIQAIVDHYTDLIGVFNDLENEDKINGLEGNPLNNFKEYFKANMGAFLTYKVPDKFEIEYKRRPLREHSLGQRASALIIFFLTLKDSDLIIIDQPEDDLDNQTIYEEVIKTLKDLKNSTQFIFATHNPNIPVLGDGEQIISCRYDTNAIKTRLGSIDREDIRQDIVSIMEGGKEAFENRKKIYELWMR